MKKVAGKFEDILTKELKIKFDEVSDEVKNIIMTSYDSELIVIDRKSKTNPLLPVYRDLFEERLNEFDYIQEKNDIVTFAIPDMKTFDFSGHKMRVIEQILEGTAGIYVEVSAEDYEKMFGKRVLPREPLDASVPRKELIYLMRYDNRVRVAERNAFNRNGYLVRYPFSNAAPISVLDAEDMYVKNNMDKWVEQTIKIATKKFKRTT